MFKTGSFNNALPFISLYAFAGYRLMPALQVIYISIMKLVFVGPSIDLIHEDLNLKTYNINDDQNVLNLKKNIKLNNISYNYPNSSKTALKNININIPVNSTVGIVGPTGCGKTTTVDIILGLLEVQGGV